MIAGSHCTFKILPIMDAKIFFTINFQEDCKSSNPEADMQNLISVSELAKFYSPILAI